MAVGGDTKQQRDVPSSGEQNRRDKKGIEVGERLRMGDDYRNFETAARGREKYTDREFLTGNRGGRSNPLAQRTETPREVVSFETTARGDDSYRYGDFRASVSNADDLRDNRGDHVRFEAAGRNEGLYEEFDRKNRSSDDRRRGNTTIQKERGYKAKRRVSLDPETERKLIEKAESSLEEVLTMLENRTNPALMDGREVMVALFRMSSTSDIVDRM